MVGPQITQMNPDECFCVNLGQSVGESGRVGGWKFEIRNLRLRLSQADW